MKAYRAYESYCFGKNYFDASGLVHPDYELEKTGRRIPIMSYAAAKNTEARNPNYHIEEIEVGLSDLLYEDIEMLKQFKRDNSTYMYKTIERGGWRIAIVLGWENVGENMGDEYSQGDYHLSAKVAIQKTSAIMQCDYDFDWAFPIDKTTGECFDTSVLIYPDSNLEEIAKDLETYYNDVLALDIDNDGMF